MREKRRVLQMDLLFPIGKKVCPRCGESKSLAEFPFRTLNSSRRNAYCKPCSKDYCREYYYRTREKANIRRRLNARRHRKENRARVQAYLAKSCCVDCGETDSIVLEFDHVNGTKMGNISDMAGHSVRWSRLDAEIAKCQVRCANCHRRRTHAHRNGMTGGSSAW